MDQSLRNGKRAMSLKFIDFVGVPRERGRQHGEIMRLEITANAEFFLSYFCGCGMKQDAMQAEAERWLFFLEQFSANYVEELQGIAEAANLPVRTIAMLNVWYEMMARLLARELVDERDIVFNGCTSAGLMPEATAEGTTLLAQTIDGHAPMCGTMFIGKVPRSNKPSWLGVFEAGGAGPIAGLNDMGIGVVINGLLTRFDGRGPLTAPTKLRCRSILEEQTFDRAIREVIKGRHSTSINYLIGHAEGEMISIETSPLMKRYLYPEAGLVTHANHFEAPEESASELEQFVPSTLFRSKRFGRHLRSRLGSVDVSHVLRGLQDHFSYPASICVHPDKNTSGRQAATLAAVIVDLKKLVLFATDGPPCNAPLQQFDCLSDGMRERAASCS